MHLILGLGIKGIMSTAPLLDRKLSYGIFRITLGINILIHGAGRIFGQGTGAFAAKLSSEFAGTVLPSGLIHLFLTILPFAEAILGALITLGLLTRWALALGGLLIAALIFGTALRSDWNTVGIQMIYAITYYLLLANVEDDYFSLDTLFSQKKRA
jgi:thiosulfate dehydrogenase [quinone] large subunit